MSTHSLSNTSSSGRTAGPDAADSTNSLLKQTTGCMTPSPCLTVCEKDTRNLDTIKSCLWGALLLLTAIISLVFTPLDLMLYEKMNMRPGLPPYEWWADPPDEVKLRFYIFNTTNHERFMSGEDAKPHVEEIGPFVYLEKLLHSSIVFNDNSTMSYTARRFPIHLPAETRADLNATVYVPNLAVLGIASYLHNYPFFVKAAYRMLVSSHGSKLFVKTTIQDYLWNFRDPVLQTSRSLVPSMVPVDNMGMLARIYDDFTDNVTVLVGSTWGERRFFEIDRFRGQVVIPGYDVEKCPDRVFGSTEGVMYRQRLRRDDVLLYWRKTVCKLMPLYFDQEVTIDGQPLYRYNLSESVFARVANGTDCYAAEPPLPAGLSDASKCYFDFPMVASFPHFYTGLASPEQYVTGLAPDRMKHNSYVAVEPYTGTPFRSVARMQSNLRLTDLSGFSSDFHRFSGLVLPLFWAEYNQEGLPKKITYSIYFMTVILPPLSTVISCVMLTFGCYILIKQLYLFRKRSPTIILPFSNPHNLSKNKLLAFDRDSIVHKPS